MTTETFLWHDFETFGADPRRDRPCQFAAIRTDSALEIVDEPVVWYSQPTSDVLPVPEACLITGITPQIARERGMPEYEFANRIFELMSVPGTCSVGYNNFRFDDEVSRFLFWRNFIDPYAREYANGNSRFDLIDVMRLAHALRPEGIEWHQRQDGTPGFRLEDLAAANGFSTERAHDALADVENTLNLARLLQRHQPKLWQWCLSLRARHRVESLLAARQPMLHVSSRFPASEFCIAPVLPLFQHPKIKSQWLVWNLREDPAEFMELDPELLSDLFWTANKDLPEGYRRLPVKWIRSNRCPMISPMGVLDARARQRTGIDPDLAARHAVALQQNPGFTACLAGLFRDLPAGAAADAETALYEGFVSRPDRMICERLRGQAVAETARGFKTASNPFGDERLNQLLLHYLGRHAEDLLEAEPLSEWQQYRQRRLHEDPDLATLRLADYRETISQLLQQRPEARALLGALLEWPGEIGLS
ncbi:MAG: exodeoxyribonuclease I [Wenzhouxiangellaceae bacterium]|nr:exodeoxyribonuclease I [Wenzhouxiangellaceae bacterium]